MMNFYVVATPIGNLEDMTLRALRILKEVDIILCEDTRVTKKLLAHYSITTQCMSYNALSSTTKEKDIAELIRSGKTLALVSDAGTPCVSDPGVRLIDYLYAEIPDIQILSIPGPSALTAALSVAGMSLVDVTFRGFAPHKKGRKTFFEACAHYPHVSVFYESPHRIMKTLESLSSLLTPTRTICVAKEITKIHEQIIRGTAREVLDYFTKNPDRVRGEFVVSIDAE